MDGDDTAEEEEAKHVVKAKNKEKEKEKNTVEKIYQGLYLPMPLHNTLNNMSLHADAGHYAELNIASVEENLIPGSAIMMLLWTTSPPLSQR